jgi:hypothetical protein
MYKTKQNIAQEYTMKQITTDNRPIFTRLRLAKHLDPNNSCTDLRSNRTNCLFRQTDRQRDGRK